MRHSNEVNNLSDSNCTDVNAMTKLTASLPFATKSQPSSPKNKSRSVPRHTKRPSSERRFKCDQCDRMFFTRKDVKRHMVVHTGIRNFACPFCTQRFGRKDHLVRHAKKSHNRDTRTFSHANGRNGSTQAQRMTKTSPLIKNVPSPNIPHILNHTSNEYSSNAQANESTDSSLVLLHVNNGHNASYVNSSMQMSSLTAGPVENGIQVLDSNAMTTPNPLIKVGCPQQHYFTLPVPSPTSSFNISSAFLPGCFVSSGNGAINSCNNPAAMTAFSVPVCGDHTANAFHTFSFDMNTSLPHFSQAFQ